MDKEIVRITVCHDNQGPYVILNRDMHTSILSGINRLYYFKVNGVTVDYYYR